MRTPYQPRSDVTGAASPNIQALVQAINDLVALSERDGAVEAEASEMILRRFDERLELGRRDRYSTYLALSLAASKRMRPGPVKQQAQQSLANCLTALLQEGRRRAA